MPERDCTGKYKEEDLGSGNIDTVMLSRMLHVDADAVRLDSSMDARSASVDCVFFEGRRKVILVKVKDLKENITYKNVRYNKIQEG